MRRISLFLLACTLTLVISLGGCEAFNSAFPDRNSLEQSIENAQARLAWLDERMQEVPSDSDDHRYLSALADQVRKQLEATQKELEQAPPDNLGVMEAISNVVGTALGPYGMAGAAAISFVVAEIRRRREKERTDRIITSVEVAKEDNKVDFSDPKVLRRMDAVLRTSDKARVDQVQSSVKK